jgi:hypothetical protein
MTLEELRRGPAAVALRRLCHPGRDARHGGAAEDTRYPKSLIASRTPGRGRAAAYMGPPRIAGGLMTV